MGDHSRHGMPAGFAEGKPLLQAVYNVRMGTEFEPEDWAVVSSLASGPAGGDATLLADRRAVDENGNTRLHNCIWDKAPLATIQALISGYPEAVLTKSSFGQLPLDLAISAELPIVQALVAAAPHGLDTLDDTGRTFRDIVVTANSEEVRRWARTHGAFLGRYQLAPGPAIHTSGTARAQYATDVMCEPPVEVCLKHMRHRLQFEAEIRARSATGLGRDAVISVRGWHTPASELFRDPVTGRTQEPQSTGEMSQFRYVLVMEKGERSLHDACAKERMAGYDALGVLSTFSGICQCVRVLHSASMVHGDLKQRNILRFIDQLPPAAAADGGAVPTSAPAADVTVDLARTSSSTLPNKPQPPRWVLCDMDAAAGVGHAVGTKTSSAYAPPELARVKVASVDGGWRGELAEAELSFDVWSLGVVLFELCAGRTLFSQDTNNDELVDIGDWTRLCTWDTITDWELAPVFKPVVGVPAVAEHLVDDVKHLIRWCLKGNPAERPSIRDVLSHPFLDPGAGRPPTSLLPMRYHCFLSHSQADASGTASDLFHLYRALHLHAWLDMKQQALTLDGMRQGVRDSAIFVLVLSENVLSSWFCQQEILCAVAEGKHIQLVLEQEPRFRPFDAKHWQQQQQQQQRLHDSVAAAVTTSTTDLRRTIRVKNPEGQLVEACIDVLHDPEDAWQAEQGDEALTRLLCATIDRALLSAVNYRRRDYEQEAMMRELCRRNGVVLPSLSASATTSSHISPASPGRATRVFVIHSGSGAEILCELSAGLKETQLVLTVDPADLETADRILVVLTSGLLADGSPSLAQLQTAIELDEAMAASQAGDVRGGLVRTVSRLKRQDRIVLLFSGQAGWSFGCAEAQRAPARVQQCLDDHEAIAFRQRAPASSAAHHEFPAMLRQLLRKLGAHAALRVGPTPPASGMDSGLTGASSTTGGPPPISSVRERLVAAERALEAKDRELEEQRRACEALVDSKQAELTAMAAELACLRTLLAAPPDDEHEEGVPPMGRTNE